MTTRHVMSLEILSIVKSIIGAYTSYSDMEIIQVLISYYWKFVVAICFQFAPFPQISEILLRLICTPNLKCQALPIPQIGQKHENWVTSLYYHVSLSEWSVIHGLRLWSYKRS